MRKAQLADYVANRRKQKKEQGKVQILKKAAAGGFEKRLPKFILIL